jgi:hypothetical protein
VITAIAIEISSPTRFGLPLATVKAIASVAPMANAKAAKPISGHSRHRPGPATPRSLAALTERRGIGPVSAACRLPPAWDQPGCQFAVERCGFGRWRSTVRAADGEPGVECQLDFGRLGLVADPVAGRRRVAHALIFTAVYSRICSCGCRSPRPWRR